MRKCIGFMAAVVAVGVLAAAAGADEEKISLDKLPKKVMKTVKARFPKAKLLGAEKENENGKTVYEVKLKNGKDNLEVILTPEGKIVTVEKEIAIDDLPEAVTKALNAKYPKATLKKAEEISKGGDKVTAYEMLIVTADKKTLEVTFDPKGKFLEEEKKGKKEEKKEKE